MPEDNLHPEDEFESSTTTLLGPAERRGGVLPISMMRIYLQEVTLIVLKNRKTNRQRGLSKYVLKIIYTLKENSMNIEREVNMLLEGLTRLRLLNIY